MLGRSRGGEGEANAPPVLIKMNIDISMLEVNIIIINKILLILFA